MKTITYDVFSQDVDAAMDEVEKTGAEYKISRRNHEPLVLLTAKNYNSLLETLHILSSPANADMLRLSMQQAKNGQFTEVDLDD